METLLEYHTLANLFPLLEGAEFDELVADVKTNGLHEPIVVFEEKILDGRNRYRACQAAGVEPTYTTYQGDDPLALVISLNLKRRHLNESQRAMVAARLATLRDGQRADHVEGLPIGRASDLLNVGERSVARAREVIDRGAPELVGAVDQGKIAVSLAAKFLSKPAADQLAIVKKVEDGCKPMEAARQVKVERIAARKPEEFAGRYRVFYADPPWEYGNSQHGVTTQRDHYPCISLDDICAIDVQSVAEDDAVLFLWATSPILPEALRVVEAWGFAYKASFVWDKCQPMIGHYNMVAHELLLICTRGACRPDTNDAFVSGHKLTSRDDSHTIRPRFRPSQWPSFRASIPPLPWATDRQGGCRSRGGCVRDPGLRTAGLGMGARQRADLDADDGARGRGGNRAL